MPRGLAVPLKGVCGLGVWGYQGVGFRGSGGFGFRVLGLRSMEPQKRLHRKLAGRLRCKRSSYGTHGDRKGLGLETKFGVCTFPQTEEQRGTKKII